METDNDKKLKFVEAMTKHGLRHFASGGGTPPIVDPATGSGDVSGANAQNTITQGSNPLNGYQNISNTVGAAGSGLSSAGSFVGNAAKGLAKDFTVQNNYSAGLAPTDYTNYQGYINPAAQNSLAGYNQAQNIQAQQQGLANQLGEQAQGRGPNVALNQLNNTTGQNIQNQAALMASQRGSSANPGMLGRQAGMMGSSAQQNAAGQAAVLRANQQIAAQQALGQQQGLMGQQNIGEQGAMNNLFGGAAAAQNAQNNSNIANYGMEQGINAQIAQANANANNKTTAGILGGGSSAIMNMLSKGGAVDDHHKKMAMIFHPQYFEDGGMPAEPNAPSIPIPNIQDNSTGESPFPSSDSSGGGGGGGGGGAAGLMALLKKGGKVPGKAKVKDDSSKNDTVPAMLSAGEIVIPRHITMHPEAPKKAAEFVRAVLAKRGKK